MRKMIIFIKLVKTVLYVKCNLQIKNEKYFKKES